MSSLRKAFIGGSHLTSIGVYFNQAILAVDLGKHPDEVVREQAEAWVEHLGGLGTTFANIIADTQEITAALDIAVEAKPPRLSGEYLEWANEIHTGFMEKFGSDDLERYLYLYGHGIGEMLTLISVLCCLMDFQSQYSVDFEDQLKQNLDELPEAMDRWNSVSEVLGHIEQLRPFWRQCAQVRTSILEVLKFELDEPSQADLSQASDSLRKIADRLGEIEAELAEILKDEN
jgi:hypothetical protein